jgi:AcrR family transcriptional regulator
MSRRREDPTPIWARPEPGERRPRHTREQIAEAALRIADAEGFYAVTMRRIARELRAGTMTLYHYVRTKDELTALMDDAVMAELVVPPDELADGWREALAQIAQRSYAVFQRHPWVFDHLINEASPNPGGPNALRHVEQSLEAASRTGLPIERQFDLIGLVDDYVFGHAMRARARAAQDERREDERVEALIDYLDRQLATGAFPRLDEFVAGDTRQAFSRVEEMTYDSGRFDRGLQAVLDGIERWLEPSS